MPYADYEKQKQSSREYYYKNKEAKLAYSKEYYIKNKDAKNTYGRKWATENPEKVAGYMRKYAKTDKGKVVMKKASEKYLSKNKRKTKAHYAVHNATRRGDLIKPTNCEDCKDRKTLHGHHYLGYNKVNHLSVKWLCAACHKKEHTCLQKQKIT